MRHVRVVLRGLLALAAALLFAGQAGPGYAAVFTVNNTADAVDANPGDGLCATAQGACTLRAAIQEANALAGPDTIILPTGIYGLTTPGRGEDAAATGDLDITGDLAITGAGADATVIDGGGWDGIFQTAGQIDVHISGVTIRNGATASFSFGDGLGGFGGGISNGTGVTMTLTGVTVIGNWASHGGGGISNGGTLTLADTIVSGNSGGHAVEAGGGGGISSWGTATLIDSVISGNLAGLTGGGISAGGTLTLIDSTVSNNTAAAFFGGGISAGGIVTITNSTISGNTVGLGSFLDRGEGGGILVGGLATITNSTVSGNTANVLGGGIYIVTGASIELTNVTVSGNSAGADGGGIYNSPANGSVASIELKNTIVAKNLAGGNCAGAIISAGHNLEDADSCGFSATGDVPNADPLLGPLADNGGPTPTHALLAGSPAIDAGDSAGCPAADQRGVARPLDGDGDGSAACDIGAYEAEGPLRRGDADCDGEVDAVDALLVLRRAATLQPYAACIGAATVDCDLDTDAVDALFILRHVAALPIGLPEGCPPIG